MHGLLPADIPRRILSLAAAAVVPAAVTAVLALAAPAQAQPAHAGQAGQAAQAGRVSIVIDSMTPQTARPGSTVTVAGTVTNATTETRAGLDVQLLTSSIRFQTRDAMDGYVSQGTGASLVQAGDSFFLAASLRPGVTVQWHASFQVNTVGMDQFGVYPVSAQLVDGAGDMLGVDQTLLPFWPGQQAAGLARPLDIAWAWPLVDQPHHQVCSALTNNNLATSLAPGGRLSALLGAGQANPGAHVTWVVDPALLSDVNTMTKPYQVASGPGCSGWVNEPASKAATTWLGTLRGITAGRPPVLTPYANVDVSALVHNGLASDITSAYTTGYAVAGSVLHGSTGPKIALPAGGTADLSVLTNLATAQHIGTAVLDSDEMPPADTATFEPDDAITSIRTPSGVSMTILLADHVLTGVLAAGDTSSGVLPPGTQFAVTQRFLAETAMIAAEAPDTERSIVVAPPQNWSPSATLASDLLGQTASTPWLSPTPLGSLAAGPDSERHLARQPPPASKDSPGELTGSYLSTVARTRDELGVYQDLLYQPSTTYVQGLAQALTATESSAWRGRAAARGQALALKLSRFMSGEEGQIHIIAAQQVPMGGSSGLVPLSIQNGTHHAIQVRLNTHVVNVPDRTSQLSIGHFKSLITVPPQQAPTVRLPVSSAPIGPTDIQLTLTTVHGKTLPLPVTSLTVQSTRYGRAILFLIGAAIGVLVLTSVFRGVRRRMRAAARVAPANADLPGSVDTSSARHPTEAPDDLADARRWADDA
ncbi:MAG TPA: DUF6049 family protein [Streptosporangiaceae bacterium]|nr:DUF6049 family protein [Streptosporangiaceae bacterium]